MSTSAPPEIKKKKQARISPRIVFSDVWCFLGLGFGSGLSPKAPGTLGTLAAIPLYWLLSNTGASLYIAITFTLFLLGIHICRMTEKKIGIQDHSGIVWDEVVGLLVTMTLVTPSWLALTVGFLAFRVFDVLKPWPIRWFDRKVHGGFGIMLDDLIAGVMACATTHLILPQLPL